MESIEPRGREDGRFHPSYSKRIGSRNPRGSSSGKPCGRVAFEFVLALEMGALLEDVAGTVHAHPTMSEAFHESVLKTLGHAIHIN